MNIDHKEATRGAPKLITLDEWAAARYGDSAPKIKTLRRWVRAGKIIPKPKKNGRSYFVSENARYIDFSDPDAIHDAAAALSGTSPAQHG